jgi:hypothetical protein
VTAEQERLEKRRQKAEHWGRWGPYVSERQWGTVREDYSPWGTAWEYLPHDQARSRAYRWGEDGIAGISDDQQLLCFSLAMWNGRDPILKERLFGLTNSQGNHGEDVKEYYFYLDNLPSHAYMKMLYRYVQDAFPYQRLIDENARRTKADPEFELIDTGLLDDHRFFDVYVEYAKADPDDVLIRITAINQAPEPATIDLLPTLWFRNTWSWRKNSGKPSLQSETTHRAHIDAVLADHPVLGRRRLYCEDAGELLFSENETNYRRLFDSPNAGPYVKDGIDEYVVHGNRDAVNPLGTGTKAAARYRRELQPGESWTIRLRLTDRAIDEPFDLFEDVVEQRRIEADEFYAALLDVETNEQRRAIARQGFAGMLWSKQFYYYVVQEWLDGDPAMPPPPPQRKHGRNAGWDFFHAADILSMPDTWEYPWFAAWDLAFHCVVLALIDPEYAKRQLLLLTREWYMHPNGETPAYEWAFGDVNPPLLAWAAMRVYQIEAKQTGVQDKLFLERVFQKLLLTFTWWVNRKDEQGNNIFQGGFLGLDNIGVFDRDMTLPAGVTLDQSDGTSWMGVFSINMLTIALELAPTLPAYEDIASKFFAHFLYIVKAMNELGGSGLWDEADGFYYDYLHDGDRSIPLRTRSLVGVIPLVACAVSEQATLAKLKSFSKRVQWFVENRPDLTESIAYMESAGIGARYLLAIADTDKLIRMLRRMLDTSEFLSPYGIRSLSRVHLDHPFTLEIAGTRYSIGYEPAESRSQTFGGNSNWRGPVWFPINFLLIEALQKFHYYYGDDFRVELPFGSGSYATLWEVAADLSERLIAIFERDDSGKRAVFGGNATFQNDPLWRDLIPFYEYFNGDDGAGLGASHQTGWTALVTKLILQRAEYRGKHPLDSRPTG